MRLVACLLLLGGALVSPSLAAGAGSSLPAGQPEVAAIEADLVTLDLDREVVEAEGSAVLSYGNLDLHADHLLADQRSGQVTASGNLSVAQQTRHLQGDALEYNVRTDQGVLSNARVEEQGVIIRGEKIEFSADRLVAHNAYFTTCQRPDPHYAFSAGRISLTAQKPTAGGVPESGRLTLNRARVRYHHRSLFTVPNYSVSISRLREPRSTPLPVTGFSREDGPFTSMSYTLGKPDAKTFADFGYRYTTYRGVRGHLRFRQNLGQAELFAGYIRREDITDEELHPDQIEYGIRNTLVNRAPEYGIRLPELAIGRLFSLHGEWLRGTYSERYSRVVDTRAKADRDSLSLLLSSASYSPARGITLSHALGWRHSSYSPAGQAPGDDLTVRFLRHSLTLAPSRKTELSLSYITRRGSGESPFLFDQIGVGRELLADVSYQVTPLWRVRVKEVYNLGERHTQDIDLAITRTAHCLDYTFGWRKSRGSFFLGVGLAPLQSPS